MAASCRDHRGRPSGFVPAGSQTVDADAPGGQLPQEPIGDGELFDVVDARTHPPGDDGLDGGGSDQRGGGALAGPRRREPVVPQDTLDQSGSVDHHTPGHRRRTDDCVACRPRERAPHACPQQAARPCARDKRGAPTDRRWVDRQPARDVRDTQRVGEGPLLGEAEAERRPAALGLRDVGAVREGTGGPRLAAPCRREGLIEVVDGPVDGGAPMRLGAREHERHVQLHRFIEAADKLSGEEVRDPGREPDTHHRRRPRTAREGVEAFDGTQLVEVGGDVDVHGARREHVAGEARDTFIDAGHHDIARLHRDERLRSLEVDDDAACAMTQRGSERPGASPVPPGDDDRTGEARSQARGEVAAHGAVPADDQDLMFEHGTSLTSCAPPDNGHASAVLGRSSGVALIPHTRRASDARAHGAPVYSYVRTPGTPAVDVHRLPVRADSSHTHTPHAHDFPLIACFERAGAVTQFAGRIRVVEAGDVHLVAPGEVTAAPLSDDADTGSVGWSAFFAPDVLGSQGPQGVLGWHSHRLLHPFAPGGPDSDTRLSVPPEDRPRWSAHFAALATELEEGHEGYADAVVAHLTLLLVQVARLAQAQTGRRCLEADPILDAVFASIETTFREPVSLRDVADAVGLTPGHLTTVVGQRTGRTVQAWIAERRMVEARRLLLDTDLLVQHVAEQAGFTDASYFTRRFRRDHGLAPGRWRRAARG